MTPEFDRYIDPARRHPQIWRLLLGLLLIGGVYIGLLVLGGWALLGYSRGPTMADMAEGRTPLGAILLLLTFAGMALGVVLATWLLHKRSPATLIGPGRLALRHFLILCGVVVAAQGIGLLIMPVGPGVTRNLDLSLWLSLLPLALPALLLQTGAEELVFRGYLQQQLAARFRSPFFWMVLPSILFGLLHYNPQTMGGNTWLIVAATALFGLLAADLTARTGTLGAAWGLHMANNTGALLFVSAEGQLDGLALWTLPFPHDDVEALRPLIALDMLWMLVIWGLARVILRR